MKKLIYSIVVLLFLASCNNEVTQQLEPKGVALGVMNEIVVIADDELWESAIGDTFRYYFESAYPILPTPEPLFDLRQFTVGELDGQPLRKELRSYAILADLSDEDSPTTQMVKRDMGSEKFNQAATTGSPNSSVGKDKWARGQILVYVLGTDRTSLAQSIKENFSAIAGRVNQHDEKQLKSSIYVDRINIGLGNDLAQEFGIDLQIPGEYLQAVRDQENQVTWLKKVTSEADYSIVLIKEEYKDQAQLTKDGVVETINRFGANYVTSDYEDDTFIVNTDDLPIYEYSTKIDNKYTKELRGTWEMTGSFSAGPFISYSILNDATNEVIHVLTFVLAPGELKRDMMMQLDYIVKSAGIGMGNEQ